MDYLIALLLFSICFALYGINETLGKILAEMRKPESTDKELTNQTA